MAKDSDLGTGTGHPVPAAVARARAEITAVADHPTWSMTTDEVRTTAVALLRKRAQDAELLARVLAEGERNGAFTETGATGTAAWLAHHTQITRAEAARHVTLAEALQNHDTVRDAMAAGLVHPDQATAICTAVEELPDQPALRELCEKELVGLADHYDARELKEQGRKVLAIVDPEAADAHEAKVLEREEKAAAKATSFSMWETGEGTVKGKFTLPQLQGGMLRKALMALAAPKHVRATHGAGSYDHQRPTAERLGQAFSEYVSRFPATKLPKIGGLNATVVVTMTLETLEGRLHAAGIDTGGRLSPGAARRLAAQAGLIPAVLGTDSHVLDLGRTARYHNEPQRLALQIEQKQCRTEGCQVPAWLGQVHHDTPWFLGGHTNTKDGRIHCPRHHTLIHQDPPTPPLRT